MLARSFIALLISALAATTQARQGQRHSGVIVVNGIADANYDSLLKVEAHGHYPSTRQFCDKAVDTCAKYLKQNKKVGHGESVEVHCSTAAKHVDKYTYAFCGVNRGERYGKKSLTDYTMEGLRSMDGVTVYSRTGCLLKHGIKHNFN